MEPALNGKKLCARLNLALGQTGTFIENTLSDIENGTAAIPSPASVKEEATNNCIASKRPLGLASTLFAKQRVPINVSAENSKKRLKAFSLIGSKDNTKALNF